MLIGITGKAGAGKDTVADYLVAHHGLPGTVFEKMSCAGPLKQALASMGFPEPADRAQKELLIPGFDFSWRQAAQRLGTEWGRVLDQDLWVKLLARRIQDTLDCPFVNTTTAVVVSDIRFENEAYMIRQLGGTVVHLVGRQAELGDDAAHASEAGIKFHPNEDMLIDNRGTLAQLYAQVHDLLGQMIAETK